MASEYTYYIIIKDNPDETDAQDLGNSVLTILNAGLTPPAYCFSAELNQD